MSVGQHRMSHASSDTWAGLLAIAFGMIVVATVSSQVGTPVLFFGAPPSEMSPRVFPLVSAGLMILFGAAIALRGQREPTTATWRSTDQAGYTCVALSVVVLLAYALSFVELGFVIASALTILALSIYYGNRNLFLGLAFAAFIPLGIFNLFTKILKVLLPEATFLPQISFM